MSTQKEGVLAEQVAPNFSCILTIESPHRAYARITVPQQHVDALYHEASHTQMRMTEAQGFRKGGIPIGYIQDTYRSNLIEHLEEFFLNYHAIDVLHRAVREQKILLTGNPRLTEIDLEPQRDATLSFDLSICPSPELGEWKYLPFKAPKRKNYKDLDRQVSIFVKNELEAQAAAKVNTTDIGDWVLFSVAIVNADHQELCGETTPSVWLKIGDEEADADFRELLVNTTLGDVLYTRSRALQEYFSELLTTDYLFKVTILDILKSSYFCFESFKKYFRLKTNKELHRKLIEVFSFRNDLSQRRATASEALRLILSRHHFALPQSAVIRQQEALIDRIKQNTDYHVYRTQNDFKDRVRQLAEKEAREVILLDQIAYDEGIKIADADVKGYLNLINRPRMKDFIYFDAPATKIGGQETPISVEQLKFECLREKALNHIIYYLTRE